MAAAIPARWQRHFEQIVGAGGILTDEAELAPHLTEWRGLYRGSAALLLRPANVAQVSSILTFCNIERIGVVPQGGNTGLVGGAIPHSSAEAPQIILSAERLNRVREIDERNYTITAEAGCILAELQQAAERVDRLFPLSLAAEGSCQLGGNISTNAGGTNVLRYGNMRDLVLGLEVVLPDGRVFNALRALRKDNTGYDLKQLFIGAEGTLGFITAATCKLFPRPDSVSTALVAVPDAPAAIALYTRARRSLRDQVTACELINGLAMKLVLTHIDGTRNPLSDAHEWYVLLETSGEPLETYLSAQLESGVVADAVIAQSETQRQALWRIRHSISEAQKRAGAGIKHDISVPVSEMASFLDRGQELVNGIVPGAQLVSFGHLGDGNIHFNVNQPPDADPARFLALWERLSGQVHSLAVELGGSFSAEHGIGRLKIGELQRLTAPTELDLMRAVKRAIDPTGIMNPGKILGAD